MFPGIRGRNQGDEGPFVYRVATWGNVGNGTEKA